MSLRLPAEHGAWGMLAIPFLSAAAVANRWNWPLLLCGACALALYLLRGFIEAQGGDWKLLLVPTHLALAAVAALSAAALLVVYQRYALIVVGALGTFLYGLHHWLLAQHNEQHTEKRSLVAALVGVGLLSLTAPAAWIASRGRMDAIGAQVWLLNLAFFVGGVLYVKYRVRGLQAHRDFSGAHERLRFAWPVIVYHLLLVIFLAAWVWVEPRSVAMLVAFTPGVLRAGGLLLQLGHRFPIKRLGWTEVAHAVVFAVLLVLAFHVKG
jgi:hypothetical protein